MSCVHPLPYVMYLASVVESDMQFYFLLNQDIRFLPRKKHPPEVLFLSFEFPAQLASQYPTSLDVMSWVYQIP